MPVLIPTPIVDNFDRLEHPKERDSILYGPLWVPLEDARELERDLMVLGMRLWNEPLHSMSPGVLEVLLRLKPHIERYLSNGPKTQQTQASHGSAV